MKTKPIDMRMTWCQAARIYIAALEDGTPKGKQAARAGLLEMARAADAARISHELCDLAASPEGKKRSRAALNRFCATIERHLARPTA